VKPLNRPLVDLNELMMILDNAPPIADIVYMAKRQIPRLRDQVRQAIRDSDATRYQIAKATGIDQASLSKFISGERGLSLGSLDLLAEFLNLQLTVGKPRTPKES